MANGTSIKYRLYKDTRQYTKKVYTSPEKTTIDETKSVKNPNYKKWNARAVHTDMIGLDNIAEEIQQSTTLTKADVKACLEQLITVVGSHLRSSHAVKLDGFGIFKAGIKTSYADTMDDFTVGTNVIGMRVNFQPAFTVNTATNQRTDALLHGARVTETPKNVNL